MYITPATAHSPIQIRELAVRVNSLSWEEDGALLSALRIMRMVRVAEVPVYTSSSQHLEALGAMPHLEELALQLLEPSLRHGFIANASGHAESSLSSHAESSLLPLDGDLESLVGLHSLMPLLEEPHVSATNATTQPFPTLHTLFMEGRFSQMADLLATNRLPMRILGLRVQSAQTEQEMAITMEVIARSCPHLQLVVIHIEQRCQFSWIDTRQLGTIPFVVFVAGVMFRMSNVTPELERAVRGQ